MIKNSKYLNEKKEVFQLMEKYYRQSIPLELEQVVTEMFSNLIIYKDSKWNSKALEFILNIIKRFNGDYKIYIETMPQEYTAQKFIISDDKIDNDLYEKFLNYIIYLRFITTREIVTVCHNYCCNPEECLPDSNILLGLIWTRYNFTNLKVKDALYDLNFKYECLLIQILLNYFNGDAIDITALENLENYYAIDEATTNLLNQLKKIIKIQESKYLKCI